MLFFSPSVFHGQFPPPKKHGANHLFNLELKKVTVNYDLLTGKMNDRFTLKNHPTIDKSGKNHLNHPKSTPPPFFLGGGVLPMSFFQRRRGVSRMKKIQPKELRSCSCTDKSAAWSCWGMWQHWMAKFFFVRQILDSWLVIDLPL